jgi:hypothetical protein
MHDSQRPPTLYRDAPPDEHAAALRGPVRRLPDGGFLALSFSTGWDKRLFDVFSPADRCLVIHNTELFGERLHRAVQRTLPNWAGIDGQVEYGTRSPLGAAFTKSLGQSQEKEWQFAWRSMSPGSSLNPVVINIGSIEAFAELREREFHLS